MTRIASNISAAAITLLMSALPGTLPPAAFANAQSEQVVITVHTVADEVFYGDLLSFSLPDGVLLRGSDGEQRRVPLPDLVRVDTHSAIDDTSAPRSQDWTFTFTDGTHIYGRIVGAGNEVVVVETVDLGNVTLPLDSLRRIDSPRASDPAYRRSADWFSPGHPSTSTSAPTGDDRVLLINGDVLSGFLGAVDQDGLTIDGASGEAKVPLRRIVAVLTAAPPPSPIHRPYLLVTLRTTGQIAVTQFSWSGAAADGRLRDGQSVKIDSERIVRAEVVGGRWEWLASHQPVSHQHTPMFSLSWPFATNRNVMGGPLCIAGETFEHGLGVHSRSGLKFELQDAYRTFVTYFGIDDDSGPYADVSVRILVDGKPLFEQDHVRRGQLHGPVRLDVDGAKLLELVVDFGKNGDIQDRFDWIEPALIR